MKASTLNSVLSVVLIVILLIFGGISWLFLRAKYTRSNYELIQESQYVHPYQFSESDGQLVNSTARLAWDMKGERVVLYDPQYKRYLELPIEDSERLLAQYPFPPKDIWKSILLFLFDNMRIFTLIFLFLIELVILSFPQALLVTLYIRCFGSLEDCQWYLKEDSIILLLPQSACHVGMKMVKSRRELIYKQELDQLMARADRSIKDENLRTMLKMPLQSLSRTGYDWKYPIYVMYDNRLMDQKEYYKKLINQYQQELSSNPKLEGTINDLRNALNSPKEYFAIPSSPFESFRMSSLAVKALEEAFGKLLGNNVYHFSAKQVMRVTNTIPGIYLTLGVANTNHGSYYEFKAGNVLAVRMGFSLSIVNNGKETELFGTWLPMVKNIGYTYYDDNFDLISCYETYINKYMEELVEHITK